MATVVNSTDVSTAAVGQTVQLDLKAASPRWVVVKNASPFFLTVNTKNNEQHSLLPGEVDLYELDVSTRTIEALITASLSLQNPPATAIITVASDQTESRPSGVFPVMSTTFVGVGNFILQANQVVNNDTLAPGSQVLFTTDNSSGLGVKHTGEIGQDGSAYFGRADGIGPSHLEWDNLGNLKLPSEPVMLSGFQISGYFAHIQNNCVNTSSIGSGADFSPQATNVPTSLTITDISTSNAGAANVANFRVSGVTIFWTPGAAGQSFREATFVTVGN